MPGYEVTPVEPLKSGLQCLECKLVLRDPVQTDEGDRLCRTCYDIIKRTGVSEGGVILAEHEACYPDRAVGKEIKLLLVKCSNHISDCPWQGKLQDLEEHVSDCKYQPQLCSNKGCGQLVAKPDLRDHEKNKCIFRVMTCKHCQQRVVYNQLESHYKECAEYPIKCDRCSSAVKKSLMEDHLERHCPLIECLCGEQILRAELEAHYSEPRALFKHMNAMLTVHQAVLKAQKHLRSKVEEKITLTQRETTHPGELLRVENEIKMSQTRYDNRLSLLEKKISALEPLKYDVEAARNECARLRETSRSLEGKVDEEIKHMQSLGSTAKGRPASGVSRHTESYPADSRMTMVEKKVEDLERQNTMLKVHVSELELQLQASLASTHNGSFLWRIPDVRRRRKDAVEERITSIYSPPFYTGRNGYKMCIRAYLNGDGIGFKSHLSLFFVLMRGEYDPLLKWPFEYKVSLILVDQDHRKHIVQTFKPTPDSSSFKRPTSDMNVASGCPQFSKVDVLDEKNYVKDDIMYIKCIVDVSRIFHP